ncbi:hypothetical protein LCGC14_2478730, partial [marine sediment metagenome]
RRIQDEEDGIGKDEPVFLFRAQDTLMVPVLQRYLELVKANPDHDKVLVAATTRQIARVMVWQLDHETKEPDTPKREVVL